VVPIDWTGIGAYQERLPAGLDVLPRPRTGSG
jgi:hypothetical protein